MQNGLLLVLCGDEERRQGFLSSLSGAGWKRVLSASSMAEAARLLRDAASACVIVDAELDDIPGLKAVPILRNLCEQIRIVFTAARNTIDLEAEVRALDVFYYYVGPALNGELVDAVRDASGAPDLQRGWPPPKVLIVDDDPYFQTTARTMLESAGYTVLCAYSEHEGLDAARRELPDLILLDIIMQTPTDGFEFCRKARRDPRIKDVAILGISAIGKAIAGRRPPEADDTRFPVDGYLSKPTTPEKLLTEVRRLLPAEQ
jgi:CheY-like chemotaxis protein